MSQKVDQSGFVRKGGKAVPDGYVVTPGGFRHISLTHRLPKKHHVRRRGGALHLIEPLTGQVVETLGPVPDEMTIPDLGSGWITYASWSNATGTPISRFTTTWTVPPAPETDSGQTVFLFNAIEDAAQDDIVQPVLQWGISAAGGGSYWAIANWYVDNTGHAIYSSLVQVNPGDVLTGIMTLASQTAGAFNYVSSFAGHNDLDLAVDEIGELIWATETLEAYQISDCSNYPNAPQTAMSSIGVTTAGTPALSWQPTNSITDCNQSSNVISGANPGGEIDIVY